MKDYVMVIGSAMIDIIGKAQSMDNVCNPGNVKVLFGGVSRNIVENLLRIAVPTKYITVFGDDPLGTLMKQELFELDCDLQYSLTVKKQTSIFMSLLNAENTMVKAIVDSEIMNYLTMDYLKTVGDTIKNARLIVLDVNNPQFISDFVNYFGDVNIIIDPVSPVKALKIKSFLPYFHTIKPNLKEAESLCGFALNNEEDIRKAGSYFISLGIKNVFITLAEKGVYYKNKDEEGFIRVENVNVVNKIGAGDAYVSGICYGYLNNLPLIETAKFAYAMALESLSSYHNVNKEIDITKILTRLYNTSFKIRSDNEKSIIL